MPRAEPGQNILAELNLYKGREKTAKDADFLTMWRRYSTSSPCAPSERLFF